MNLSLGNFFHYHSANGKTPGNFPVGSSSDHSAIKKIIKSDIEKWPRVRLQMLMDYCISKEIFEVAAIIRDAAFAKGVKLRTA
jgi:hypothetical protein